ncbi:uncharacterized protein TRIADDRAFT_23419 [Trichoplax adhaerens]|uniref:MPN domain-containing protein n=1 Tax=Trichoplax adhaerens TaxID=10228 RepID=B3RVP1_TRIAD|nr:hypothetical protein TRIADDRAFT_23419 [Trichoplax adhaerens]EDV26030.1 hypothetical protein TRIADDRAFT_23419 [Trichoplax adhaerens]|eukprot:XP_002112063.1 hypothetical protein TRIADDRAFT_23419 [Trichoplax adhaerens]
MITKPEKVVVHPTVLLSVVDHFKRLNDKRVVGILLGSLKGQILDVSNSFAVPFEEEEKNPDIWYLDHDYLENMYAMFKKVNAREKVVGWYHTGPKIHSNDISVNEVLKRFVANPVLVIIDAQPKDLGIPTDAFIAIEEVHDDGTPTSKTFENLPSEIGAEEPEEVGVEHLLRDIKDSTAGTLSQRITSYLQSLKGAQLELDGITKYLDKVIQGKLPLNHQTIYTLQEINNLLPNVNVEEFAKTFTVKTNDQMLVMYLASMIRAIIALHNLINNKEANRNAELNEESSSDKPDKSDNQGMYRSIFYSHRNFI